MADEEQADLQDDVPERQGDGGEEDPEDNHPESEGALRYIETDLARKLGLALTVRT